MRLPASVIAALFTIGAALPSFSLGNHKAGQTYTSAMLANLDCKRDGEAIVCMDRSANVAGTWAIVQITISKRKLSRMVIAGDRDSLPKVEAAMRSRYGNPCATGSETIVNGLGNSFPSKTATWCFATGKLVLHSTGLRMTAYKAVYEDEANPPPT